MNAQTTIPDPAPAEETPKLRIEYGMLVEEVDRCTCGAGGEHGHEPGCGLDPWMPVSVLVADLAELARVRPVVDAAREVAAEYDEGSGAIVVGWKLSSALTQLAAALDGDAAATPEAVRCDSDEVDDCSCGAAAGPSAPPVDVTARLAEATEVAEAENRPIARGVLEGITELLEGAARHGQLDYVTTAIVRALATPSTDTPGGDR